MTFPKFRALPSSLFLSALFLSFVFFFSCKKDADAPLQNGLYKNGTLSTGPVSNSGVAAPAGTTWSECQPDVSSNTSNWNVGIGNFYNSTESHWTADDFTIPAGQTWNISKIAVYGMRWNVTSNPFDVLHLQIWNGKPGLPGSSVIYGDASTNYLSEVTDSLIYGIQNSLIPAPGVTPNLENKFWKISANVNKTLTAGTYWLAWQTHTVTALSAFTPLIKMKNMRSHASWNAVISNVPGNWVPLTDPGNPNSAPDLPQDLPFEIVYTY